MRKVFVVKLLRGMCSKWWRVIGDFVYLSKLILIEFQVILIGHGIGGLSVIHAMHEFVDRIKQAIFVAAAMLPFGLQTDEDKKDVCFVPYKKIQASLYFVMTHGPPTKCWEYGITNKHIHKHKNEIISIYIAQTEMIKTRVNMMGNANQALRIFPKNSSLFSLSSFAW